MALSASTSLANWEGQLLGDRYRLHRLLGSGRLGPVYAAMDRVRSTQHAVKILDPALAQDDELRLSFLRGARSARLLAHPNIVEIHAVDSVEDSFVVAMEILSGTDLCREFDERKSLGRAFALAEIVKIGSAVCEALAYAHEFMAHGDLRPQAIWLCADGSIKLKGFRSLEAVTLSRIRHARTDPEAFRYVAPEYPRDGVTAGPRGDQYSVAAILLQMLHFTDPSSARPRQLRAVWQAVLRGLSPEPDARFPDMNAFGKALASGLPTRIRVGRRIAKRRRPMAMAAHLKGWTRRGAAAFWRSAVLFAKSAAAISAKAATLLVAGGRRAIPILGRWLGALGKVAASFKRSSRSKAGPEPEPTSVRRKQPRREKKRSRSWRRSPWTFGSLAIGFILGLAAAATMLQAEGDVPEARASWRVVQELPVQAGAFARALGEDVLGRSSDAAVTTEGTTTTQSGVERELPTEEKVEPSRVRIGLSKLGPVARRGKGALHAQGKWLAGRIDDVLQAATGDRTTRINWAGFSETLGSSFLPFGLLLGCLYCLSRFLSLTSHRRR
jgi:serine/threonine protein kinase